MECAIQILIDRRDDGRFHVHSPEVPGFHLVGKNPDDLRVDFEPVLRDLLRENSNFPVDRMRFVPNLEGIFSHFQSGSKRETCIISLKKIG